MVKSFHVEVHGKSLQCHHCDHDKFSKVGFAHFGTWIPRLSFDCLKCGHAHVFLKNAAVKFENA